MPSLQYKIKKDQVPYKLIIEFEQESIFLAPLWKNITIWINGSLIGSIANSKELKEGREFPLDDGSVLKVQYFYKNIFSDWIIEIDGHPVPGTSAHPLERLKICCFILLLIACFSLIVGSVVLLGSANILKDKTIQLFYFILGGTFFIMKLGPNLGPLIWGSVYLVLTFFVWRRSQVALGIAIGAFILDAFADLLNPAFYHQTLHVYVLLSIVFLLRLGLAAILFRGFSAIKALKRRNTLT